MMKMTRHQLGEVRKVLRLLGVRDTLIRCVDYVALLILTRGPVSTLRYLKDARLAIYRFISGAPITKGLHCKLTKDGLPAFLPKDAIQGLRDRDVLVVQEVLNLMRLSYLLKVKGVIDTKAITDYSTAGFETGSYANLVAKTKLVISELGIVIPHKDIKFGGYHLSTKMGPLGLAISSAMNEFLHPIFPLIRKLIIGLDVGLGAKFMYFDDMIEDGFNFRDLGKVEGSRELKTLRKLSEVEAPEGKVRLVALVDYWTQSALRPLHLYVLKRLSLWFGDTDRSLNQQGRRLALPPLGHRFHSFDLKGFTDRFPIKYQEVVVEALLGTKFMKAWSKLLVGFAYDYKGNYLYYRCGQPMGAYTSWVICTLCHHLVVRVCGHNVYKHCNFDQYMILGDDLVIFDDRVAAEYVRLIGVLGVEINWDKSLISSDSYEFAKRLFVKGVEVSGLPWDQLFRVTNPLTVLGGVLADTITRNAQQAVFHMGKVRKWIAIFANRGSNSFIAVEAIYLQALWIMSTQGVNIDCYRHRLFRCTGSAKDVLSDILSWWALRRLEQSVPEMKRKVDELNNSLTERFSSFGPMNWSAIPQYDCLYHNAQNVGSWLVDLRQSNKTDVNELLKILSEADSAMIGEVDFRRRLDRVRELVAHGLRKSSRYEAARLRETKDTR